jgi:chemotaxis protein MotB
VARGHGGGSSERWLITYSDLITLLMVFFIVMYSISEADKDKYLVLKSSLQRALNGDSSPKVSLAEKSGGDALLESPRSSGPDGLTSSAAGDLAISPLDAAADLPDGEKIDRIRRAIETLARERNVGEYVDVFVNDEGIVVSLSGPILFGSGRAELKPEGTLFLDAVADVVRDWPNRLRVEGHTDNVPIESDIYPSNWELSSARAVVVTRYLAEQQGLDPRRVGAAGYGEYRSVVENDTREGRQRNRRVDLLVLGVRGPLGEIGLGGWSESTPGRATGEEARP